MIQVLKQDMLGESSESESLEPQQRKVKKSLFASLLKRRPGTHLKMSRSRSSLLDMNLHEFEQELKNLNLSSSGNQVVNEAAREKQSFFHKLMKKTISKKELGRGDIPLCPTSYIPKYSVKLITGVHELQDILQNLYQCEEHMIFLIKKHITDQCFQTELLQKSFEYFALQYDSKCQNNALANDLWLCQLQIFKNHEYNLQKRLNHVVDSNRGLQNQLEALTRQYEKSQTKSKIQPKRLRKTFSQQLLNNNKKLTGKLKTLRIIISDFESEMQKIEHLYDISEEEKRSVKSQIFQLERKLEKEITDYKLEQCSLVGKIQDQSALINDSEQETRIIFKDLMAFSVELKDFGALEDATSTEFQDCCLVDLIYQLRVTISALFSIYRNVAVAAKDADSLRKTNCRLQENLQRSTNELDNLTRRLGQSSCIESKCCSLEEEAIALRLRVEELELQYNNLKEELCESKQKIIDYENMIRESSTVRSKIDDFVKIILRFETSKANDLDTSEEKIEFLQSYFISILSMQKELIEEYQNQQEEIQTMLGNQEELQKDLTAAQDIVSNLSSDNDILKKSLAMEHQTVLTLQTERIKYLEEKNLLKTLVQHLRSEISRIQQLEASVCEMSKETSRLNLIAEFNKQLGEQLKSEVEVKNSTISELQQTLEQLSHVQVDNDKEKMTLCAQLSELELVKNKLKESLEEEVVKNQELDKLKKKLEHTAKSQMKIYEEMQQNERSALKELLRDFRGLVQQRDGLIHAHEQDKKKIKELEKQALEIKREYNGSLIRIQEKEEEVRDVKDQLHSVEVTVKQMEHENQNKNNDNDKQLRKIDKLLGKMKRDKAQLEETIKELKNNLDKTQAQLKETQQKNTDLTNTLNTKTAELGIFKTEIELFKKNAYNSNQENERMKLEITTLKKVIDAQTTEMKEVKSINSVKENICTENKNLIHNHEQKIASFKNILHDKERELKELQQETIFLKKKCEEQEKIMEGYENQLFFLQNAEILKEKAEQELKIVCKELESEKKETEVLNERLQTQILQSEKDKEAFRTKNLEFATNISENKVKTEQEIQKISNEAESIKSSLKFEKDRFELLCQTHKNFKTKFNTMAENYASEVATHIETYKKLEEVEKVLEKMVEEQQSSAKQFEDLLLELDDEKETNENLKNEISSLKKILEQGSQQYNSVLTQNNALKSDLTELRNEVKSVLAASNCSEEESAKTQTKLEERTLELNVAKETLAVLQEEIENKETFMNQYKEQFFEQQQLATKLEFQNCELTLQLHELQAKLQTDRELYNELQIAPNEGLSY